MKKSLRSYPEYNIWRSMISRCYNPNNIGYSRYGKRGITVCEEWKNSLECFIKDMGPRPSLKHSIERIDNDGHYCKENCKWATSEEQNRNRKTTHIFNFQGENKIMKELVPMSTVCSTQVFKRLKMGFTLEEALTKPKMRGFDGHNEDIIKLHNKGLSQRRIADSLGISQAFVSRRLLKIKNAENEDKDK